MKSSDRVCQEVRGKCVCVCVCTWGFALQRQIRDFLKTLLTFCFLTHTEAILSTDLVNGAELKCFEAEELIQHEETHTHTLHYILDDH